MIRRYLQASLVLVLLGALLVAPDTFAKGGRGFSGGGRSFSGGSRTGGFGGGFGSNRSFSTPRSAPAPSSGTFRQAGGFTTRYDNNAASAQRAQSSKSLYEQANGIFSGGRTTSTQRLGPVTQETIETRPSRLRDIFSSYSTRPVTVYHDSFNPWFWMWLMDRSQRDRDMWVYNHRDEMDQDRYRDLVQKDADLEHRLSVLENQGVPHDPSYTPAGVDQDLMYDDSQVQSAYAENQAHGRWGLLVLALVGIALAYLIFFVPMLNARRPGLPMEQRKLTPWQAFKDLVGGSREQPLVLRVYNPFALKPLDFVTVDDVLNGVAETRYQVTEVDMYRRTIGDRTFESVDYVLQDPVADAWLTLRVSDNGGTPADKQRTVLLLFPDFEGEYDENLHKQVLPSGILELKDDQGELIARYERLNGLKDPYRADVLVLAGDDPPRHESFDYWDFGRKKDGREEFYFVEMNAETGVIQTWRAVETTESELSFLRHAASAENV